jgi:hypothetical protein
MKLRFTIRDLLWLTLVVALAVAWWLDKSQQPYTIKAYPSGVWAIKENKTNRTWSKSDTGLWIEFNVDPEQ